MVSEVIAFIIGSVTSEPKHNAGQRHGMDAGKTTMAYRVVGSWSNGQ
jgi:hypothetical protein